MPQPLGSPGGQTGTGIALVLLLTAGVAEDAFACVVATTPVRARTRTKARMRIFILGFLFG